MLSRLLTKLCTFSFLLCCCCCFFTQTSESFSVISDSLQPHGLYRPWNSPGQNTGVGSLSLLQGIFPTQGLSPGLLHYRQSLYLLSHQGSPNKLRFDLSPPYNKQPNKTLLYSYVYSFVQNNFSESPFYTR